MTFEKQLKDGTTFYVAQLADGLPLRIEVMRTPAKALAPTSKYGAPPFIAIGADGTIEPTCAPGDTAEDAALELVARLNQRYAA
jgi:hypothetical protein